METSVETVIIGFNDYLTNGNGEASEDRGNLLTMVCSLFTSKIGFLSLCLCNSFFSTYRHKEKS